MSTTTFQPLSAHRSIGEMAEYGLNVASVNKIKGIKFALLFGNYLPEEYRSMFAATLDFDDIADAIDGIKGALPHKSNTTHQKVLKVVRMVGLVLIPLGILSRINYIQKNAAWFTKGIQLTRDYHVIRLTLGYSFLIGTFENLGKAFSAKESKKQAQFSAACLDNLVTLSMIAGRDYLTKKFGAKAVLIIRTVGLSCAIVKNALKKDAAFTNERIENYRKKFDTVLAQDKKYKDLKSRLSQLGTAGADPLTRENLNKLITEFNNDKK